MRFSEGHSNRANSVAALAFAGGGLDRSIARVEAAYRARGLVPQFSISPATEPEELPQRLHARNYTVTRPVLVAVGDARAVADGCDSAGAEVLEVRNAALEAMIVAGSHCEADGRERLDALSRIDLPLRFALVRENGAAVSCGACVVTGEWASLYTMRTDPAFRGKHHAQRVLGALAHWCLGQGLQQLFLQVEEDNTSARKLYRRAGFKEAYRYCYYRAPG